MKYTAKDIAALVGGTVLGDPSVTVFAPGNIEHATQGQITFLANPKYEPLVYTTKASIVLVSADFVPIQAVPSTLVAVDQVYRALGILLAEFEKAKDRVVGISNKSSIHESVILGDQVAVGDFSIISEGTSIGAGTQVFGQVFIGRDCKIGKNCILYPGVKIYHGSAIGDDCILHANVVIGSDGFGFTKNEEGRYTKIAQIGYVQLGDRVEVGSNTVIDRATMDKTYIANDVKLDNLIQIAHNVKIGANTVIAAQSGVAGSTEIGEDCMIGGQVGIVGHIKIADQTMIQAQSGIASAVTEKQSKLYGSPAIGYSQYLKSYAYFKKLPDIIQTIRQLEKELDLLKQRLD